VAGTSDSLRMAVLGLGEAGARIAADLRDLGVTVRGHDPIAVDALAGVERVGTVAEAVASADVVLALVPASAVVTVATEAGPALAPGAIYAECAASSVAVKRAAADHVGEAGGDFADVAILGVVPATGIRTPALLSGPGALRLEPILTGLGMPVAVVSDRTGDAAGRKLLRSVFMKGLAAVIGEAMEAAHRLDCESWVLAQIEDELRRADASLVARLQEGTMRHARRRVDEMAGALELLEEHGLPAEVTGATLARLTRLAETGGVVE